MARRHIETRVFMDTVVFIEMVATTRQSDQQLRQLAEGAFGWFAEVERRCSRFDDASELRSLDRNAGAATAVSPLLFNALALALEVAELTSGALDPTIGATMERRGFDRNYVSGRRVVPAPTMATSATYRDVVLDRSAQTVTLLQPVRLDLGAVAKGLAIDLAARELRTCPGFVINAGGDIFAGGHDSRGDPWTIGIQHPRRPDELITSIRLTDAAVCTSGDYERPQAEGEGHHIMDPTTRKSATSAVSATVIAPTAVAADAISTAAFVLGPEAGLELLHEQRLDGLIVDTDLLVRTTHGLERLLQ